MPQVLKMALVLAKLQRTLDVYEGLFGSKDDAAIIFESFAEIGGSLKSALATHLIIGCAAIFSDPEISFGNENMSLRNLVSKHESQLGEKSQRLLVEIWKSVEDMNLKKYRNKHVGHFGLEECLGYKEVDRDITVQSMRCLLKQADVFINQLIADASLLPEGHALAYYNRIPELRGTNEFLRRIQSNA
ncbi:hypothetical protein [Marinobacter adhaerens]|uniref:hypothetical protein n=1 Tax=Marinobacter adhaerens TaxID=1033846 RepID=UPI001E2A81C3|nr:hypothetical protein [Marinobacter adhaerens]MCD1647531.1 hypothetical protein [Marinobacter adhaerens]